MYKEWAEGQINKMKGILNSAREGHTSAVKSRIENVKQLGGVVEVTKQLFEVSKVCIYSGSWSFILSTHSFIVDHPRGYPLTTGQLGNRQDRSGGLRVGAKDGVGGGGEIGVGFVGKV